jgi:hypothetical protein
MYSLDNINYCLDSIYSHYYDLYITHNGFDYVQEAQSWCNAMHLTTLVFFHQKPPVKFKKEDGVILKNALDKTNKIFMSQEIGAAWGASTWNNTYIIEYGVPVPELISERTKSILFINQSNNTQIHNLYSSLVNKFHGADLLQILPLDINIITKTLLDYRVVVDMDNTINSLLASACGCKVITSPMVSLNADIKEVYKVMNYDGLTKMIENIMLEPISDRDIKFNQQLINNQYSYNTFSNKVTNILTKAKKEIFVL